MNMRVTVKRRAVKRTVECYSCDLLAADAHAHDIRAHCRKTGHEVGVQVTETTIYARELTP